MMLYRKKSMKTLKNVKILLIMNIIMEITNGRTIHLTIIRIIMTKAPVVIKGKILKRTVKLIQKTIFLITRMKDVVLEDDTHSVAEVVRIFIEISVIVAKELSVANMSRIATVLEFAGAMRLLETRSDVTKAGTVVHYKMTAITPGIAIAAIV